MLNNSSKKLYMVDVLTEYLVAIVIMYLPFLYSFKNILFLESTFHNIKFLTHFINYFLDVNFLTYSKKYLHRRFKIVTLWKILSESQFLTTFVLFRIVHGDVVVANKPSVWLCFFCYENLTSP